MQFYESGGALAPLLPACNTVVVSELEMTVGHCLTNFRNGCQNPKNYTHLKLMNGKSLTVYSNIPTVNQ